MRIKKSLIVSLIVLAISVPSVSAHVSDDPSHNATHDRPVAETRMNTLPATQNDTNTRVPVRSEPVEERAATLRETVAEKRMEALNAAETRREQFNERLQTITDTQKRTVVQRLDNQLIQVNTTATDRWTDALEKMSGMVERASTKAGELEAAGANTTALNTAITNAEAAITRAQTAVSTQAGKSYIATITNESALRTNIGTTVSQLRADLRVTYTAVNAAKQSVLQVVRALATASSVTPAPQATDSAEIE